MDFTAIQFKKNILNSEEWCYPFTINLGNEDTPGFPNINWKEKQQYEQHSVKESCHLFSFLSLLFLEGSQETVIDNKEGSKLGYKDRHTTWKQEVCPAHSFVDRYTNMKMTKECTHKVMHTQDLTRWKEKIFGDFMCKKFHLWYYLHKIIGLYTAPSFHQFI